MNTRHQVHPARSEGGPTRRGERCEGQFHPRARPIPVSVATSDGPGVPRRRAAGRCRPSSDNARGVRSSGRTRDTDGRTPGNPEAPEDAPFFLRDTGLCPAPLVTTEGKDGLVCRKSETSTCDPSAPRRATRPSCPHLTGSWDTGSHISGEQLWVGIWAISTVTYFTRKNEDRTV